MVTRVQAQYTPRATGLERVVAPQVTPVAARYDTPQESSGMALARALGALDTEGINAALRRFQDAQDNEERRAAEQYANSITLDELGKKIRNKEMLPSQSPVFAAALQHIYAENYQKQFERDTLSGIAKGELKFSTPGELDQFLVDRRNEFLSGQSEYVVAGFDKGWNALRDRVHGTNLQITDAEAQNRAIQEATDNLSNHLLEVTAPDFTGTVDDAANALISRYEFLTGGTQLLRDDSRKAALQGLMVRIAASGRRDLAEALLNKKLPNNGPTVGAFLGDKAISILNTAEVQFDKGQRQITDEGLAPFYRQAAVGELDERAFEAFRKSHEKYVSSATYESILRSNEAAKERIRKEQERHGNVMEAQRIMFEAGQVADALVADGRGYAITDVRVPTPEGGTKTIKAEDIKTVAVQKRIAADPDMSTTDQIRLYAQTDLENPQWANAIRAASGNLSEVGIDAKGKPVGELLPATIEALDQFAIINQTNPQYARKLAGDDTAYNRLFNIQALRESGVPEVSLAASLVNQADNNVGKNIESINAQVLQATNSLMDPSIFTGRFWGELFAGEWGEGTKNVRPMRLAIQSLAKSYMAANVVTSGDAAVELALKYYANPAVTTQINNAVYLNKDLPRVPDGQTQREWMQRFFDEKVAEDLKAQGIDYDADDVNLLPMQGGEPRFMLQLNGTTMGVQYTRRAIEKWIEEKNREDIIKAGEEAEKRKEQQRTKPVIPRSGQAGFPLG